MAELKRVLFCLKLTFLLRHKALQKICNSIQFGGAETKKDR